MVNRIYSCKNEEVPVIGRFLVFPLRRDINDFSKYLPKIFSNDYVVGLERQIENVNNLLNPQAETVELKNTTNHMHLVMDGLIEPIDIVSGYVRFTKGAVPISVRDFGLTALRQKIRSRDSEGVLKNLRIIIDNLERYRPILIEQGFDESIVARFTDALPAIEADNQHQFEIINKRKTIVENNIGIINDLYKTIMEVCNVGKTLYKGKDDLKVKDYTFTELKKSVRRS